MSAARAAALGLALACFAALGCAASRTVPARGEAAWRWEGERRIETMVEIPPGVTLQLLPGTVLRFAFVDRDGDGVGDAGLHVQGGRIEARGEPGAPVVFTSAEPTPQPGDWRGLVLDDARGNLFRECVFEYAEHALHAHFSTGLLERCRLERNVEGTRLGDSRFEIRYSLVRGNVSKGINFRACGNHIHHNTITGNGVGIFLFERDTESVIERNNLFGNESYDFRLGDFYRGGARLAQNWWGTVDPERIRARVYDGEDDPALERVEVVPAPAPFETGWESP